MTRYRAWVSLTKYRVIEFDYDGPEDDAWDYATNFVWNTPNRIVEEKWEESGPDEIELEDIVRV